MVINNKDMIINKVKEYNNQIVKINYKVIINMGVTYLTHIQYNN